MAKPDPETVIASLYDAALEPDGWPTALEHLASTAGAVSGHFLLWNA
jgi:hypothetical protein